VVITVPHETNTSSEVSRIEQFDDGPVLYLALDPDGEWARSEFPDDLVTLDYDSEGQLIGIEVIGALAQTARNGLVTTIAGSGANPAAIREALGLQGA
jgi:uncharacterized protein YuzE